MKNKTMNNEDILNLIEKLKSENERLKSKLRKQFPKKFPTSKQANRKENLKKYLKVVGTSGKEAIKDLLRERKEDREIFKQIMYS